MNFNKFDLTLRFKFELYCRKTKTVTNRESSHRLKDFALVECENDTKRTK